jgi:hypothetical protein
MKAKCSVHLWGAERKDPRVVKDVAAQRNVKKGRAGKWDTNLLAGADTEYVALRQAQGACRDFHYANTLKWGHGEQVLPNDNFLHYVKGMGELKGLAEQRLEDLTDVWDERVKQAKENSPELTQGFSYPTVGELRSLCGIENDISPMAESGDLVLDVADEEAQKLLAKERDRLDTLADERVKEAMSDLWNRLGKILDNAKRNLNVSGEGRFRTEWYYNLKDFAESVPRMNFDDDENLRDLGLAAEKVVNAHDIEVMKEHADEREDAAAAVDEIMHKMRGVLSATP